MSLHEFIVRESTVEYASTSSFNALGSRYVHWREA